MTIFSLLKSLHRGKYYQVPADFAATAHIIVDSNEAGKQLTHIRNHFSRRDFGCDFQMEPEIEFPVWDELKCEMVIRPMIKVNFKTIEL